MTARTETHPRIQQRRADVEVARVRGRNRKLVGLAMVVVLGLIGFGVTQSPLLDVDEVRIIGAARTEPDELRELSGVEPGTSLVGLDLGAAERRLLEVPAIESVESARTWSGVVTFEVREREPVARIHSPEGVLIAARDGLVIEITDEPDESLPLISGAMFSSSVGAVLPPELADPVLVADSLPPDIARVTERIELSVGGLALRLDGGGLVEFGDARALDAKFDALRAFLAQVDLSCLGEIDVQAPQVPVLTRGC